MRLLTHSLAIAAPTAGLTLVTLLPFFPGRYDSLAVLAVEQSRGHYAVHDAPHAHWKCFWFD